MSNAKKAKTKKKIFQAMKGLVPQNNIKQTITTRIVWLAVWFLILGFFAGLSHFLPLDTLAAPGINSQINYQGKLSDTNGLQVNDQTWSFRFRIYDAPIGGSLLWTERWTATTTPVATVNGVFSVALGSLGQADSLADLNWNNDSLYLQIDLDADANGTWEESFAIRKRLTAVAYAFNSRTVGGFAATSTATAGQLLALDQNAGMTLFGITTTNSLYVGGGITLGGVFRNTWPISGGSAGSWWGTSTDSLIGYPDLPSGYAIVVGGSATTSDVRLEVIGHAKVGGNLTVTGSVSGSNLNISNWDTAFGWGNHALAGYLAVESDPIFTNWAGYTDGRFSVINATTTNVGDLMVYGNATATNDFYIGGKLGVASTSAKYSMQINSIGEKGVNIHHVNSGNPATGLYLYSSGGGANSYGAQILNNSSNAINSYGLQIISSGAQSMNYAGYFHAEQGITRNYGVYASALGVSSSVNYGIYAVASGGVENYAGYFDGNVYISGNATSTASISALQFCLVNDCITSWPIGGSGDNPFNQWLDTTSTPTFNGLVMNTNSFFATTTIGDIDNYITFGRQTYTGSLGTFNFPVMSFNSTNPFGQNLGGFSGGLVVFERPTGDSPPFIAFAPNDMADSGRLAFIAYNTSTNTLMLSGNSVVSVLATGSLEAYSFIVGTTTTSTPYGLVVEGKNIFNTNTINWGGYNYTASFETGVITNNPFGNHFTANYVSATTNDNSVFATSTVAIVGSGREGGIIGVGREFGVGGAAEGRGAIGILGYAYGSNTSVGVFGLNLLSTTTGTNIGVRGHASGGAVNWAGYFDYGNVFINNILGIGTSTPSYRLTVNSGTSTENLIQVATTTHQSIFEIRNDGLARFGYDLVVSGTATSTFAGNVKVAGNIEMGTDFAILHNGERVIKFGTSGDTVFSSTHIGTGAGNSGAFRQTVVGYYAGKENVRPSQTAIGFYAGKDNLGANQTVVGDGSGENNTGDNQTAIGYLSGQNNTGNNQIAIGYYAGRGNTGNNSILFGYEAGVNNTRDNQFIVQQANINVIPLLQGDFSTGSLGINTSTPWSGYNLAVAGSGVFSGNLTVTGSAMFQDAVTSTVAIYSPRFCIGDNCITSWPIGGSGDNPFNQWLDTTSTPTFNGLVMNTNSFFATTTIGDIDNYITFGRRDLPGNASLPVISFNSTDLGPFGGIDGGLLLLEREDINQAPSVIFLADDFMTSENIGHLIYYTTTREFAFESSFIDGGNSILNLNGYVDSEMAITKYSTFGVIHNVLLSAADFGIGTNNLAMDNKVFGNQMQRLGTINQYGSDSSEYNRSQRNWTDNYAVYSGDHDYSVFNFGQSNVLRNAMEVDSVGNTVNVRDYNFHIDSMATAVETAGTLNLNNIGLYIENVLSSGVSVTNGTVNTYGIYLDSIAGHASGETFGIYDRSGSNWHLAGNLGIGTTDPLSKLHIVAPYSNTEELINLMFTWDSSGNYRNSISSNFHSGSAGLNNMTFRVSDGTFTGSTTALRLDGFGNAFVGNNLGIGTTTPGGALDERLTVSGGAVIEGQKGLYVANSIAHTSDAMISLGVKDNVWQTIEYLSGADHFLFSSNVRINGSATTTGNHIFGGNILVNSTATSTFAGNVQIAQGKNLQVENIFSYSPLNVRTGLIVHGNTTSTASISALRFCLVNDCITSWPTGGSGDNPFNQWLDTTSTAQFANLAINTSTANYQLEVFGNARIGNNDSYITFDEYDLFGSGYILPRISFTSTGFPQGSKFGVINNALIIAEDTDINENPQIILAGSDFESANIIYVTSTQMLGFLVQGGFVFSTDGNNAMSLFDGPLAVTNYPNLGFPNEQFQLYVYSQAGYGVYGESQSGYGVLGYSQSGYGGSFTSQTGYGLYVYSPNIAAVFDGRVIVNGDFSANHGVFGTYGSEIGVSSLSYNNAAIYGVSYSGEGVSGYSAIGFGVRGRSDSGYAGYFEGNILVSGNSRLATTTIIRQLSVTDPDLSGSIDISYDANSGWGIFDIPKNLVFRLNDNGLSGLILQAGIDNPQPSLFFADNSFDNVAAITYSTTSQQLAVTGVSTTTFAGNVQIAQGKNLQVENIFAYSPLNVRTDLVVHGNATTTGTLTVANLIVENGINLNASATTTGSIHASKFCINNDCITSWPTGGSGDGSWELYGAQPSWNALTPTTENASIYVQGNATTTGSFTAGSLTVNGLASTSTNDYLTTLQSGKFTSFGGGLGADVFAGIYINATSTDYSMQGGVIPVGVYSKAPIGILGVTSGNEGVAGFFLNEYDEAGGIMVMNLGQGEGTFGLLVISETGYGAQIYTQSGYGLVVGTASDTLPALTVVGRSLGAEIFVQSGYGLTVSSQSGYGAKITVQSGYGSGLDIIQSGYGHGLTVSSQSGYGAYISSQSGYGLVVQTASDNLPALKVIGDIHSSGLVQSKNFYSADYFSDSSFNYSAGLETNKAISLPAPMGINVFAGVYGYANSNDVYGEGELTGIGVFGVGKAGIMGMSNSLEGVGGLFVNEHENGLGLMILNTGYGQEAGGLNIMDLAGSYGAKIYSQAGYGLWVETPENHIFPAIRVVGSGLEIETIYNDGLNIQTGYGTGGYIYSAHDVGLQVSNGSADAPALVVSSANEGAYWAFGAIPVGPEDYIPVVGAMGASDSWPVGYFLGGLGIAPNEEFDMSPTIYFTDLSGPYAAYIQYETSSGSMILSDASNYIFDIPDSGRMEFSIFSIDTGMLSGSSVPVINAYGNFSVDLGEGVLGSAQFGFGTYGSLLLIPLDQGLVGEAPPELAFWDTDLGFVGPKIFWDYYNEMDDVDRLLYFEGADGYFFDVAISEGSDISLKTNINNLQYGLSEILGLRPVSFDYIANRKHSLGFIAQEVKNIIPEVVTGQEGSYGLNYSLLTALLVKGMQEQQQQIDNLSVSLVSGNSESDIPTVIDNPDVSINTLVVQQAATFYGTLYVRGAAGFEHKVTFYDDIEVRGKIYASADQAGTAVIPAGATSTEIVFNQPYASTPTITVSLQQLASVFYGVVEKSANGFRIGITEPYGQDLKFDWIALGLNDGSAGSNSALPTISDILMSLDSLNEGSLMEMWVQAINPNGSNEDLIYSWSLSPVIGSISGSGDMVTWSITEPVEQETIVNVQVTVTNNVGSASYQKQVVVMASPQDDDF